MLPLRLPLRLPRSLPRILTGLLVTLVLTLSACGGDDPEPATGSGGAGFNDADVAFATNMIQHHAQALALVDLTLEAGVGPDLAALAEQIRAAQGPEIEQMSDWLEEWDQPVPETVRDHANAHGDGHLDDSEMPGMLSADQMDELAGLTGEAFEQRWLELMIEHHEGAVEMAGTEVEDGEDATAIHLAEHVVDSQQAEIEQMEQMLAD